MSCIDCEKAQEPDVETLTGLTQATYVRVGRANVLISGCDEHLRDLINQLRKGAKSGT